MKNERVLLLLGYPWAIANQNLGDWVITLEVRFFCGLAIFCKTWHFFHFMQKMKTPYQIGCEKERLCIRTDGLHLGFVDRQEGSVVHFLRQTNPDEGR